jgi:hypothetical protein
MPRRAAFELSPPGDDGARLAGMGIRTRQALRSRCGARFLWYHGRPPIPQDAPMSTPASPALPADPLRELAIRIYVELVCRNVTMTDASAKMSADPETLAKVSFKLAESFERAERDLKQASMPKNQDFDLRATDLTGLMSTRPD